MREINNNHNANSSQNKGLISWFAINHVAANILMIFLMLGGVLAIFNMRTETFPAVDTKIITATVTYPGGTPYEIADSITNRIDEAVRGISGIKRVSSIASEGAGTTTIELSDFADGDEVYNDVETAINSLTDFPPQDAQRPIISRTKITPKVMTLAVFGEVDEIAIKKYAHFLDDELKKIPQIALTSVRGVKNYEISIEISQDNLKKYNLSLSDIAAAVQNFSSDIPAGTIEAKTGEISLRIKQKKYYKKDFENIVLRSNFDGSSLKLKDVADVKDGLEDSNLISKYNNKTAAFIDIKRNESEDTLQVVNLIKNHLKNLQNPAKIQVEIADDETINLSDRINLMARNGIVGFALVFLILLLFLDLKLAFWVSIAIPTSFLGGIMIMNLMGLSINMISLFAFIMVLGIVVDDGIVVGESIFDEQERNPNDKMAAVNGVKKVLAPVSIGVFTTMAAFFPLAFSTGTLGQIIGIIPMVIIPILAISLIDAYFILPAHLSNNKRWSLGFLKDVRRKFARALKYFVDNYFLKFAKFCMKLRYLTLLAFVCVAIFTFVMIKTGAIRFVFFPQVEGNDITISVETKVGSNFQVIEKAMLEIEQKILETQNQLTKSNNRDIFENISMTIGQKAGSHTPVSGKTAASSNNIGEIKIKLIPSDFREQSSFEIENILRKKVENITNLEKLSFQSSPIGENPDIEIELKHENEQVLKNAVSFLKQKMNEISGTKEVQDSFNLGKEEYIFNLNNQGLALGLSPFEIGRQIRNAYFGLEAMRIQRDKFEVIIYVRLNKNEREKLTSLEDFRLKLSDGKEVLLKDVAQIQKQYGYSQIQTVNSQRIVSVTCDVDLTQKTPNDVIAILESDILPEIKEKFSGISFAFEGESKDQRSDLNSLKNNMLVALLLIYVMLSSQLKSYLQPVIIMSAIPFGIIGAILGHFFFGYDLTFISMFGMVALSGVVVNDSVVLMDYFNNYKKENQIKDDEILDAFLSSISRRFRPILLTTLSTSFGLFPILLEPSMQAKFLIPMVLSLAAGILFATPIILILIPCLVLIASDVKRMFKG